MSSSRPKVFDTVTSFTFDVFGTVVDWEQSVTEGLVVVYGRENAKRGAGAQIDVGVEEWRAFARAWRAGYGRRTRETAQSQSGTLSVDEMHRQLLDELLTRPANEHIATVFNTDEIRHELVMLWHTLRGWPDSTAGLRALKTKYTIVTLSNGNVRLLVDMAKHSDLPFDTIFSAELLGAYKPNPKIYTLASHHLRPTPPPSSNSGAETQQHTHLAHVAAHISDLVAFRKACPGVRTVYVRRPTEEVNVQGKVTERRDGTEGYGEFEVDMVVDGIDELARRLG